MKFYSTITISTENNPKEDYYIYTISAQLKEYLDRKYDNTFYIISIGKLDGIYDQLKVIESVHRLYDLMSCNVLSFEETLEGCVTWAYKYYMHRLELSKLEGDVPFKVFYPEPDGHQLKIDFDTYVAEDEYDNSLKK